MKINQTQKMNAKKFQSMHKQDTLLLLPNIWDAGSGKIIEKSGFKAMATTSAGIAFANGYQDGECLPFDLLIDSIKKITNRTNIPLSVDFERGYSESGKKIVENTKQLLSAGAIGLNIEDGLPDRKISETQSMQEKLIALTTLKKEINFNFLINSRIDIYWNEIGDKKTRLAETINRANKYFSWGADCVFVPGNISLGELKILVKEVSGPTNVLLNKELNNIQMLQGIGVKRLTIGSSLSRNSIFNLLNQSSFINQHNFESLLNNTLSYDYVNRLFKS